MSEPAQECENNANFKQIYILKLFIAFKMADSCCFSLGDINYCSEVFQITDKYNSNSWSLYKNIEHSQDGYNTQANA